MRLLKFLWILLFLLPGNLVAKHLIGGEISYECLGNDNYEITLTIYRDCFSDGAEFDEFATVTVFDANQEQVRNLQIPYPGSESIPLELDNPCLAFPPTLCIEKSTYRQVVNLPAQAGGYTLVHQRCCRSPNLINVVTPQDFGSTYTVNIPGPETAVCNSSPVFNATPRLAACTGVDLNFDLSATDPDGDFLVYSLCDPLHGGGRDSIDGNSFNGPKPDPAAPPPFTLVPWGNGYSAANQIDCNPGLSINQNGLVTGIPTLQGNYLFSVCVEEYRAGVLLGTARRDYMITIVACNLPVTADFLQQDDSSRCTGLEYDFTNLSSNGTTYHWDFGDPSTDSDTSSSFNPSYTYPDTGTYPITLIVNEGWPCEAIRSAPFHFYYRVRSKVEPVGNQCLLDNSFRFEGSGEFREEDASFRWNFGSDATVQQAVDTLLVDSVSYVTYGEFSASLTITERHCEHTDEIDFIVYPELKADFELSENSGCPPLKVEFADSSFAWQDLTYDWSLGNGESSKAADPVALYEETGSYTVELIITSNDEGCGESDTLMKPFAVTVHPEPTAGFSVEPDSTSIFHPIWNFVDEAEGHERCVYLLEDFTLLRECEPQYEFSEGGTQYVFQRVTNKYGCHDSTYTEIHIEPAFVFFIPNAFTPNRDSKNEEFKPIMMSVSQYSFEIFDRWGSVIFQTYNPEEGWNGIPKGASKVAQDGIYVYRIEGWDEVNQKPFQRIGHFTLLGGN